MLPFKVCHRVWPVAFLPLDSLHMLSWLLLGAMSHNAIHSVATEMRSAMSSSGGLCLLLQSLSKIEEVLQKWNQCIVDAR